MFAEGGGNTWGVDFNEDGEIIAGTNFGEKIGLHQVQGAYYVKGFAKHGPLHNRTLTATSNTFHSKVSKAAT